MIKRKGGSQIENIILTLSKKKLLHKDMNIQNFETTTVPVLRLPLGSPKEKCHLDVVPKERHKIYYREGSGAVTRN
jgi:hypothetical protein